MLPVLLCHLDAMNTSKKYRNKIRKIIFNFQLNFQWNCGMANKEKKTANHKIVFFRHAINTSCSGQSDAQTNLFDFLIFIFHLFVKIFQFFFFSLFPFYLFNLIKSLYSLLLFEGNERQKENINKSSAFIIHQLSFYRSFQ